MLALESFIHRDSFAEIVSRWVVNRPIPGDVARLKNIVNFNSYIVRIWLERFARELFTKLHGEPPEDFRATQKGQLKDFIVQNPPYTNDRIQALFTRYQKFPEDYYRETPFDGRIFFLRQNGTPRYVGSTRIKRFRRIAEKGSRRIVEYMFDRIRTSAQAFADERAKSLGIPRHKLVTPQEQMVEEFLHAERRLLKYIRQGTIQQEFQPLSIPDVAGLKVVAEGNQFERLVQILEASPDCAILEQEHHTGKYNAINLKVAHRIPREMLSQNPPNADQRRFLISRGFDSRTILDQYSEFMNTAEDQVLLEIIVSTYQNSLESEIGQSMHEDRVLQQRANRDYSTHLATNVRYLMNYLFSLCLSPTNEEMSNVPIRLWIKYMPDTIDRLVRALYDVPVDGALEFSSRSVSGEFAMYTSSPIETIDSGPRTIIEP
ncbi:MAG: hypothetical protein V1754_05855 [Pseudomonadota bacterium]